MKIAIRAKSSSGDSPYLVEAAIEQGSLTLNCSCKAGMFGRLCKHKTELLAGKQSRLFDPSEANLLRELQRLVGGVPRLCEMADAIATSEALIKKEQQRLKSLKGDFSEMLRTGVDVTN